MKTNIYILSVLIVCLLSACTERIHMDTKKGGIIPIIYGKITTDTARHSVKISRSLGYFEDGVPTSVSNAEVVIYEYEADKATLSAIYLLEENVETKGLYETQPHVYGTVGKCYRLEVKMDIFNEGNWEIYSSDYSPINTPIDIDSTILSFNYFGNAAFDERMVVVLAMANQKNETEENNYLCKLYKDNQLLSIGISKQQNIFSDEMFGRRIPVPCYWVMQNEEKPEEIIGVGSSIVLEINNITKSYANFLRNADAEISGSMPMFSGPPANVPSNFNGNALGHFTAYSISKSPEIIVEQTN